MADLIISTFGLRASFVIRASSFRFLYRISFLISTSLFQDNAEGHADIDSPRLCGRGRCRSALGKNDSRAGLRNKRLDGLLTGVVDE